MLRLAVVLAFIAGCASETEVRGADENVQNAQVLEASEAADAATPAHEEGIPCQPGTTRACFKSWQDALGVTNCEHTVQYCRSDSRAWLACGDPYGGTPGAE